ncbi:DUF4397 domain-containing protein [Hahella sp. SMD15-11]|uniref:DUF4397 domain-containing protein n=1 Tax=Thermohahella caldifontis TaxID=3142973 RepID=A0AB39UTF6_9GAMM
MNKILFSALAASTLVLAGCGGSSNSDHPAQSSVRALHLSPDAPAVDVDVNGSEVLSDVTYQQASGFLSVNAGATDLAIRVADTSTAVIDETLNLDEGTRYTVIALNYVASIEPLVIADATSPASGFAQLRVVHGVPSAPAVDVYVSAPGDALPATPTLENVPFKAVSDELEVPAGDYRVRVTLANGSDVIYDSGTLSLADGVEYVAVASEAPSGFAPIGLTILTDADSTPVVKVNDARARLRVVHASSDAPAVDVTVDGSEVLGDVAYTQASDYLPVLNGTYNMQVAAANTSNVVIDANLPLSALTDYTVIALGPLASIEALVLQDDNTAPAAGNIRVRVVHAASQAGDVDVYITAPGADLSSSTPTLEDFSFKANSGYLEVPAGDYQVRVTLANTLTVAIDTGTLTLEDGKVYSAIARDPAPSASDFGVILLTDRN